MAVDELIVVWSIVSRIRPGDKISITFDYGITIDKPTLLTPIKRSLRGDSRLSLLRFVPQIVRQTLGLEQETLQENVETILAGVRGLMTLLKTYESDIRLVAELERSIAKLKSGLKNEHGFESIGTSE